MSRFSLLTLIIGERAGLMVNRWCLARDRRAARNARVNRTLKHLTLQRLH